MRFLQKEHAEKLLYNVRVTLGRQFRNKTMSFLRGPWSLVSWICSKLKECFSNFLDCQICMIA